MKKARDRIVAIMDDLLMDELHATKPGHGHLFRFDPSKAQHHVAIGL